MKVFTPPSAALRRRGRPCYHLGTLVQLVAAAAASRPRVGRMGWAVAGVVCRSGGHFTDGHPTSAKTKPAPAAEVGSSWRPRHAMKLALFICLIRIRATCSRMPVIMSAIRCQTARFRRSLAERSYTRPGDACAAPVPLPLQYADGFTVKLREC